MTHSLLPLGMGLAALAVPNAGPWSEVVMQGTVVRKLPLLWDKVSAAQAGLKLVAVPLPQLQSAGMTGLCHHTLLRKAPLSLSGILTKTRHPCCL